MPQPTIPQTGKLHLDKLETIKGVLLIAITSAGQLDVAARRVNKNTKGTIKQFNQSETFAKMKAGDFHKINSPIGMAAESIIILKLAPGAKSEEMRDAGAKLAKLVGKKELTVAIVKPAKIDEMMFGFTLKRYDFDTHKTGDKTDFGAVTILKDEAADKDSQDEDLSAICKGVFFTRDLVNEPANVLTTTEFATRLENLAELGVSVKVLEEKDMKKLGMGALLSVGHGSTSPSKTVIMEWKGGGKEAPLALVGKGVVFDTGGVSLKPAAGMEDMTMDMGGAGVVAGVMKTLALRKAKANVIGLVGLVENMPDALATRPGDVVTSMKGDTIEVINTDAEGRLVLADVLWYAQEKHKPAAIIDLATLTGAIIIGLGHENAGIFSNDDALSAQFLKAADAEQEGAWRMPLGAGYDKLIESRIADIKNVGGRAAGSITAAQFLQRFVKDETPWIHIDIAGVASTKTPTRFAPKGATGWGVRALNRLVMDNFEKPKSRKTD